MSLKRRNFLRFSALAGTGIISGIGLGSSAKAGSVNALNELKSMADEVKPITVQERAERIAKAQRGGGR